MNAPIDFYFDFSSPYGYLASTKIDALAAKHGRTVTWRPLKGEYSKRDFLRSARFHGIAYKQPDPFPVSTVTACRAFYSLAQTDDRAKLARRLFTAYFVEGINIGESSNVLKIAGGLGLEPEIAGQAVKDRTRAEVDAALAKGVFGSPYIIVDGEPFWGVDRFEQIDRWLREPF